MMESIKQIIDQGPVFLSAFIDNCIQRKDNSLTVNDLLEIAEVASNKAVHPTTNIPFDFDWAIASIHTYDSITKITNTDFENISSILLISQATKQENIPKKYEKKINDNVIIDWFFDRLTLPFDEAKHKTSIWKTLDIDDIKSLKKIKTRLNIIKEHFKTQPQKIPDSILPWLSIYDDLP